MLPTTKIAAPVAHLVGPGKLKVINAQLAFVAKGQRAVRLDPKALRTLVCYGPVGMTDDAIRVLFRRHVEVAWMTAGGSRCRGRLVELHPPSTAVRLLQHQAFADGQRRREWAAYVVAAKIESQLQAARHYQRHGCPAAGRVLQALQQALGQCAQAELGQLRGIEGSTTAAWFGLLGQLFRAPWRFTQRLRRPPPDPVNGLLSLGYTWLLQRTLARCEAEGLEIYLGALHEYRAGRPSLGCDLIEPLRAPAVDRWVIGLCNEGRVSPEDFLVAEGGVRLQPAAFGRILRDWEEHWHETDQLQALDSIIGRLLAWLRAISSQPSPPSPGTPEE